MDAKSLLRAKKAGARIEHPYATYSAAGQLRCSICAVPVKQWDAHLLTKAHRQSVQREKKEAEALARKKRAAESEAPGSAKRAKVSEPEEEGVPALPAGFFSAGNGPSVPGADADDEEPESAPAPAQQAGAGEEEDDVDLDAFLASLNEDGDAPAPTAAVKKARRPAYKAGTDDEGVASYSAAPQLVSKEEEEEVEEEAEPEETEAEKRARLAREEREEVMARLEEEERAQEDADARVDALKARMEALKKRMEARAAGEGGEKAKGKSIAALAMAKKNKGKK